MCSTVQLAAGALAKKENSAKVSRVCDLWEQSCQLLSERCDAFPGMSATPGQGTRGLHCLKQRESKFLLGDPEGEVLIGRT